MRPSSPPPAPSAASQPSRLLTAYAVPGIGRITPGTDLGRELGGAIRSSGLDLKDGDVVVVASKIVAKAEGALATAASRADVEALIAARTRHTVARRRYGSGTTVSIVRTPAGTVQAAAGLDRSNTEDAQDVILHPEDPDASAEALRASLADRFGVRAAVIVSDTTSRPWRVGVGDFALGCAGLEPLDSQQGLPDDAGRVQEVTVRAVADAIAQAADLVKGAARGLPAAVVRGMGAHVRTGGANARELVRDFAEDWFRYGHVEAVHQSLGCQRLDVAPASADGDDDILTKVSRALAVVRRGAARTPGQSAWRMRVAGAGGQILISPADTPARSSAGGHPLIEATLGLGALVDRLQSALWCEDLQASTQYTWADNGSPTGARLSIELTAPQP